MIKFFFKIHALQIRIAISKIWTTKSINLQSLSHRTLRTNNNAHVFHMFKKFRSNETKRLLCNKRLNLICNLFLFKFNQPKQLHIPR